MGADQNGSGRYVTCNQSELLSHASSVLGLFSGIETCSAIVSPWMNLQTGRIYIDLQPIKAVENKICDFTNLDWVGSPRDVFQVLSKSKVIQCNS